MRNTQLVALSIFFSLYTLTIGIAVDSPCNTILCQSSLVPPIYVGGGLRSAKVPENVVKEKTLEQIIKKKHEELADDRDPPIQLPAGFIFIKPENPKNSTMYRKTESVLNLNMQKEHKFRTVNTELYVEAAREFDANEELLTLLPSTTANIQGQINHVNVTSVNNNTHCCPVKSKTPTAIEFIRELRGSTVLLRAHVAIEGARIACDKGDHWFKVAKCKDPNDIVKKSVQRAIERLEIALKESDTAANPALTRKILLKARSSAENQMREAARLLWNAAAGSEKCAQDNAIKFPDTILDSKKEEESVKTKMNKWIGLAQVRAAVASRRAYEMCAARAHGEWAAVDERNDSLRRAEVEALLYVFIISCLFFFTKFHQFHT